MFLFLQNNLIMLIILQHYAHQKHVLQCIQEKVVRHDRDCLEFYASCLTPMALEPIKRSEQKLVDIFGLIRQSIMNFTSLAKHRKSFRPSLMAAYTSQLLYTRVAHVKTAGSMARARLYSRKINASIMPSAVKHVLFPLLCRHNLHKPRHNALDWNSTLANLSCSCSHHLLLNGYLWV